MNENGSTRLMLSPGRIVMLYAAMALGLIMVSNPMVMKAAHPLLFVLLEGSLFVMLTSALLYVLIRHYTGEIKLSRDLFYKAFQISPDSININRLSDGVFIHVNEGFSLMSGYAEAEVIGTTPRHIRLWKNPDDQLELAALLERHGSVDNQTATFRKKDGVLVTGVLSARLITLNGEKCAITIVRDLTERIRAEEEIQQLVYYDADTGLPNQNLLMDRLNQVIALGSREHRSTAIIYIGLSGVTSIVDAFGHGGSRDIARALAERFRALLRQSDTVARISRDEFVIVLGGLALEPGVATILGKLQVMFSEPVALPQGEMMVTAAMGVACFPADGFTANVLLQNAHIAMNQARDQEAANRFQFFSEELNSKAFERHQIEASMLRGIEDNEFYLCYQPKFSVASGGVTGMEALLRWKRPGSGVISPDKFIPIAEENGMIVKLGEWALRSACRQCRSWQDAGFQPLQVSVNISTRQLRDNLFVEKVLTILLQTGFAPENLELELTESALMGDMDDTVTKLLKLKEKGITISIDDFGTGYSSLSYLKHLPIDKIKIDRSFISEIVSRSDDAALVDAIISMANSLHLAVVAEGVETAEQLEYLKRRKCQEVQGFFYSRPLEPHLFEEFIGTGTVRPTRDAAAGGIASPDPVGAEPGPLLLPATTSPAVSPAALVEHLGDILLHPLPVAPTDTIPTALNRFQNDRELLVLPVVENGGVVGILNRATFLEEHVIGRHGFGFHINHSKKIRDLMSPVELILDTHTSIEEAARAIQLRERQLARIDNICATMSGRYAGVVDVKKLVNAMAEINISLAKGANPLTGLPGNASIQREITGHLESGRAFDIAYIDIDNFKPFNDCYGFQKGDVVIKALAEIIGGVMERSAANENIFYGHIGGDDFILITPPHGARTLVNEIIREFEGHLPLFHGDADYRANSYNAVSRKGEQETFGLLSLSIGIVNTLLMPINSYAQLASLATEVKKAAKSLPGSAVVVNKRLQ